MSATSPARRDGEGTRVRRRSRHTDARPTLARTVLDAIGRRIVSGEVPAATVLRIEDLQSEFGVSRTVIRDVLRSLESMSLVTSRRSIGVRVRERRHWSVFAPDVVQWRLEQDPHGQISSLVALRLAVEPVAASLAAASHPDLGPRLQELAAAMHAAADGGDLDTFLAHDLEFHGTILRECGNEMFAALESVLAEVLRARHTENLMPHRPGDVPLALHRLVAVSVHSGDEVTAEWAMRQIVAEVRSVVEATWQEASATGLRATPAEAPGRPSLDAADQ